jgi:hypothetical protein
MKVKGSDEGSVIEIMVAVRGEVSPEQGNNDTRNERY